jgi:hypothetical protein
VVEQAGDGKHPWFIIHSRDGGKISAFLVVLVVEEEDRQHRGNEGYDDRLGAYYSWDSTVSNHRAPQVGDFCVVRDSRGVLGVSWVDGIRRTEKVEKFRRRCRHCRSTAFKGRATMQPTYRCSRCKTEFDRPIEERIEVTVYRADYARSWLRVDGAVIAAELEATSYPRTQSSRRSGRSTRTPCGRCWPNAGS